MQSCNGSLKKVLRSELSLSWEGTCKRPKILIVMSLELKYRSRSSLPQMLLSDKGAHKTKKTHEKKKPRWRAKLERPLVVRLTICELDEIETTRNLNLNYFWGHAKVTGLSFPTFVRSHQDSTRITGPGVPVIVRVPLGSRVPVFRGLQGPARVPLGFRVPVSRYAR